MSNFTILVNFGIFLLASLEIGANVLATEKIPRADAPTSYLELKSEFDGRCYNLSAGGKLVTLTNNHPQFAIKFRLIRYFANIQQGISVGNIEPNGAVIKLGCDKVDDRQQNWQVVRASFIRGSTTQ